MPDAAKCCAFLNVHLRAVRLSLRRDDSCVAKARNGRAKMRLRRIPELGDQRMPFERLLDDAALNAAAASMNEADLAEAALPGRVHVRLDDRFDVARLERVEVERILDRDAARHGAV